MLYKDDHGNLVSNVRLLEDAQMTARKDEGQEQQKNFKGRDKRFLVYIIQQEVTFNDESHYMTFFKDITFGVLYEQIKAQEELQNLISENLHHKIEIPQERIINSCRQLQLSGALHKFEKEFPN